ncbi:MAG: T9SS type A sorting domain-containing protein, partial [Chitinophagales bacterium]
WYVVDWGKKYVDCNGDGVINDDDTAAVIANFGLDHPIMSLKSEAGDVPLYLDPVEDMLHIGLNQIPIMLGDEINSVDEIYGIRFTVTVEGEDVDAASLKVRYTDGWLSEESNRLSLNVQDVDNKRVFTGVVRKDRENTGGNGEIGTLDVVVIDNISGKSTASEATITFSEIKAIKYNKEEISVYTEAYTFGVEEGSTVNTIVDNSVSVFPTIITNNSFTISGTLAITGVEIADLAGKVLMNEIKNNTKTEIINVDELAAGQYIVTVHTAEGSTMKKIILQ